MKKINLAIVGATGAVGEILLKLLPQRNFPVNKLYLVASSKSAGKTIEFANQQLEVQAVDTFDFKQADIAIFSAGKDVARKYAPKAVAANCIVIDNSSEFRYQDDIPLIVPEVNGDLLAEFTKGIISNPNCSTIQMVVALKPIHQVARIKVVNVSTYQAVSGQGREAINELLQQTKAVLAGEQPELECFVKQMAFNVLPEIDVREENGYTREEMKMVWETKKILTDDSVLVNPTAVRVPVVNGHGLSLHIETEQPISVEAAMQLLNDSPGVKVMSYKTVGKFPTPANDADGQDAVIVGRLREHLGGVNGLNMWVVADNLRKGAALNALQITELLLENDQFSR